MPAFSKQVLSINGVRTQVLQAGQGAPLLYLHAAGTGGGFDELLPLAESRTLYVPLHPGFGESDDDPGIDSVLDYVVHYAALLDRMKISGPIDVIGHSLGGWIASLFAVFHGHRIRRLALGSPAGLWVPDHPTVDLFVVPPEKLPSLLSAKPMPASPSAGADANEQKVQRFRELTSLARFSWGRNYEPKLERWLAAIKSPVLLLWGEEDRIIPVEQSKIWAEKLGGPAEVAKFSGAGHLLWRDSPAAVQRLARFFDDNARH